MKDLLTDFEGIVGKPLASTTVISMPDTEPDIAIRYVDEWRLKEVAVDESAFRTLSSAEDIRLSVVGEMRGVMATAVRAVLLTTTVETMQAWLSKPELREEMVSQWFRADIDEQLFQPVVLSFRGFSQR